MSSSAPRWPALLSLGVHELRSPVNVVSGYVKMLLRGHGGTLSDVQRSALESAAQSCDRVTDLLAGMSELARLESGRLELARDTFDAGDLLAALPAELYALVPDARVSVAPPRTPCVVCADRTRLARAVAALAGVLARSSNEALVAAAASGDGRVVITLSPATRRVAPDGVGDLLPIDEFVGGLGLAVPVASFVIARAGGRMGHPLASDEPTQAVAIVLPLAAGGGQA